MLTDVPRRRVEPNPPLVTPPPQRHTFRTDGSDVLRRSGCIPRRSVARRTERASCPSCSEQVPLPGLFPDLARAAGPPLHTVVVTSLPLDTSICWLSLPPEYFLLSRWLKTGVLPGRHRSGARRQGKGVGAGPADRGDGRSGDVRKQPAVGRAHACLPARPPTPFSSTDVLSCHLHPPFSSSHALLILFAAAADLPA